MEELRNEMTSTINEMTEQRERREKEHQLEIKRLKEEREKEIVELREDSQKVNSSWKQYVDGWEPGGYWAAQRSMPLEGIVFSDE